MCFKNISDTDFWTCCSPSTWRALINQLGLITSLKMKDIQDKMWWYGEA